MSKHTKKGYSEAADARSGHGSAYLSVCGALVIFGTIGLLRRLVSLPSDALAFARGVVAGAALILFMRLRGRRYQFSKLKGNGLLLILSGVFMGILWILLFQAYTYTSVAVTTLCFYMQPPIVVALSPLFFHERITLKKGICILTAVLGMVFVSGIFPGGQVSTRDGLGILCGLGAAVFYALNVILNKKMTEVPAYEKTTFQMFMASFVVLIFMLLTGSAHTYPLTPLEGFLVIIIGAVQTGIAYMIYLNGLQKIPMQTAAILGYIEPITAILLSALVLHEGLTGWGILGMILILGSAFVSESGG